jgi:hypothetical protein
MEANGKDDRVKSSVTFTTHWVRKSVEARGT